jgi:hypothetical protein
VFCIRDTAYVDRHRPDGSIEAEATLIWFGRGEDSLSLTADAGSIQTSIGADRDSLHNNVPRFHRRIPRDGAIMIWVATQEERGDTVPYTLRAEESSGPRTVPSLDPTGQTARLMLPSSGQRAATEFSVIPSSQLGQPNDRSEWKVFAGQHKIALTRDSLYEVCLLPCASPHVLKIKPNQSVSWTY